MTSLPHHVSNLILSQRLKELGVPQKSLFWWIRSGEYFCQSEKRKAGEAYIVSDPPPYDFPFEAVASAFLSSELGERLPYEIENGSRHLHIYKASGYWVCGYYKPQAYKPKDRQTAPTLPDAMAKMLIFLLENGLIKN